VSELRTVFAGTPEFAARILAALLDCSGARVVAAYTQPDRPAGRGKRLTLSPVKQLAQDHGIRVFQPRSLRSTEAQHELAALTPDLMIVAAYGLILPSAVLAIPAHGCVNVHASLLPRWRGAAPVERAIEAGDIQTGITIMQMDEGLDTGAILLARSCQITDGDTGDSLRERLGELGAGALLEALQGLRDGTLSAKPQDERFATYAPKLTREEARMDWCQDAISLSRRVRAFNSANICETLVDGQRLKILDASPEVTDRDDAPGSVLEAGKRGILVACGSGALRLRRVQLAGGKPMDAAALLNGRPALFSAGTRLGSGPKE
jgi:methionyl-tRNA formyltransferase